MWSDGRNAQAIAYHAEAVAITERLGLGDLVAVQAYHGRGEAHFFNLEHVEAIRCFQRSIDLARRIGDKSYECENLMMIGHACLGHLGLGDYTQACATLEAALEIADRADLQWHIPPTRLGLACARGYLGDYAAAVDDMRQTIAALERSKLPRYQLMAYEMRASLLLELDLNAQALEVSQHGRALASSARITWWRARREGTHAIARMRLGDLDVGAALGEALRWARENDERSQMVRCLEGSAELASRRGDVAACTAAAEEMVALATGAQMPELEARGRFWHGQALAAAGKRGAAIEQLELAERGAEKIGRVRLVRDAADALAKLGGGTAHRSRAAELTARIAGAARDCKRLIGDPV
jgi:tetratricopeptide (TPR) repeat protein